MRRRGDDRRHLSPVALHASDGVRRERPTATSGAEMWLRIARSIEREAALAPVGEDREVARELAQGIRARLLLPGLER